MLYRIRVQASNVRTSELVRKEHIITPSGYTSRAEGGIIQQQQKPINKTNLLCYIKSVFFETMCVLQN